MRSIACAGLLFAGAATISLIARPQTPASFAGVLDEHPSIQYATGLTRDRVSVLNRSLSDGTTSLPFHERGGYLRPVLDALAVPADSQLLVFSKTGVQRAQTGPRNPRAIYFNDSVVVGYVPGARFLELAAHDPAQGVVFYTIEQINSPKPVFARRTDCVRCHVSAATLEVPGMITRSMFTSRDGAVMPQLGSYIVNHRTPLPNRWGGWFVTGRYSTPPYAGVGHMGNVTIAAHDSSGPVTTSNEIFIDLINSAMVERGYASAESDVASLMIFDHQMHAINLLTRLNWETRVALSDGRANFAEQPLRALVDDVVDYLLFVDEAPPPAGLIPRPGFVDQFAATGPRDRQGRSLRELNLTTRLLRYPCSYMVHTEAFNSLPMLARDAVYRRMWSILSGRDTDATYSHLSGTDRRAIVEIIADIKTDLPEIWRP